MLTAEHSATRGHNITAVAGSAVSFNCTLDVDCFTRPVRWVQYASSSSYPVHLYTGRTVSSSLNSSGGSVVNDPTRGWSALTLPRVRLTDRGRFHCRVTGIQKCQMNFQLTVTGKISPHCVSRGPINLAKF